MPKNGSGPKKKWSKKKGPPRKKPGPKKRGSQTHTNEAENAVELLLDIDTFEDYFHGSEPLTLEEANHRYDKVPPSMQKKTAKHLEKPPCCPNCGAMLRFGKKGNLCETCAKGIPPRKICTSMAEAEKSRRH